MASSIAEGGGLASGTIDTSCLVGLDEYAANGPWEAIKEFEELKKMPFAKQHEEYRRL